jgi:hypothetical protein
VLSWLESNPLSKLHGSINKRERLSNYHLLNIIEYLFCESLFGQVMLIEKSVEEKVRQKKCGRKIMAGKLWQKKCGRKIAVEKVRQEKCGRKIVAGKVWQKNRGSRTLQEEKRYGFHMCSVEFMNLVEGFLCKSVGFPIASLGLVVQLI